jgi:hypothetical protein
LPKITILPRFFPSKFVLKCCNFSRDWDRVKGFSALVTRYLMIDLGSFNFKLLASPKFSWRWGGLRPFQTPKQKGALPPSGNPLMNLLVGGRRRKMLTFFSNNSQTKPCVWGQNRTFFPLFKA